MKQNSPLYQRETYTICYPVKVVWLEQKDLVNGSNDTLGTVLEKK